MTAKKLTILIPAFIAIFGQSVLCTAAPRQKTKLLRDGFVIAGLDGELARAGENGEWFIKFDETIADDKGQIKAGQFVQLMPASTLEKIGATTEKDSPAGIRLWGRVTQYDNRNFIFPTYFLPLSEARLKSTTSDKETTPTTAVEPNINEPEDVIVLPDDVLRKLRPRRIVSLAQLKMGLESEEDSIFVERAGFIIKPKDSPYFIFQLDALGRNMETISLRLLPCKALEEADVTQAGTMMRFRHKITGILTKYDGRHYLLPQRVKRFYNYGNFAR
jgi:hypothetical protein